MKITVIACCCVLLLLVAIPTRGAPVFYHLTDLGTLGGAISVASGINASGQVSGISDPATGETRGFLYGNGVMTSIGTLGGTGPTFADGINASGQVVGVAFTSSNSAQHAFVYSNGHLTDLGLTGIASTSNGAVAINDVGQITGQASVGAGRFHAFLYSGGSKIDLGTLGGFNSIGRAINSSGQIAGNSTISGDSVDRAFLYSGSSMINLGTLGGAESIAYGIDDAGDVVGTSSISGLMPTHGFLYTAGKMIDLGSFGGPFTQARDINNRGQIVGTSDVARNISHGFLFENGAMYDLNNLLDNSGAGWVVGSAVGINDSGLIAANAQFHDGSTHAVLLTPVPAASSLMIWGFLILVAIVFAKHSNCLRKPHATTIV